MSTHLRIIVIEDSADDAELLMQALKNAGFRFDVIQVQDEPGFRKHLHPGIDLVISDYKLPAFSPLRALEIMQAKGFDLPFIIISGTIGEEAAVACMRAGAWDYLLKDRLGRLGAAIDHALERRRLLRDQQRGENLLKLRYEVVRLLTDAKNFPEVLPRLLERLSSFLGFGLAEFWSLGPNSTVLTCSGCFLANNGASKNSQHSENRASFQQGARFASAPSALKPGAWICDLGALADYPRKEQLTNAGFISGIALTIETGRSVHGVITLYNKGAREPEADTIQTLTDLAGRICDFLERHHLEQQLRQAQRMECIGQLAGGIAHDFNNLLTIMHGHLSVALTHPSLPEDLREATEEVSFAVQKASSLTQQLLAFSRKQAFQKAVLDLDKVTENMTKMLKRILGEHITLSISRQEGAPPAFFQGDSGMVEQVLLNLAVNARDAMPQGGKLIIHTSCVSVGPNYLDTHHGAASGEFVCLSVADTGTGIPPEVAPRIFEPFFTTKPAGKGTGLGLATVYGIVQEHGGWINFYSEPNKGTLFRVYLPRLETGPETRAANQKNDVQRQGHETILLVEDEPSLRALIGKLLHKQGYQVLEASSGVAALQIWSQHRDEIDLLLTDMVMPEGMTGRDLAEKLLRERPELRVIFSSGYSPEMVESQLQFDPGQSFLQKPYSPQQLATALSRAFKS